MDSNEREEGVVLSPKYDERGLITAAVTDAESGEMLMVAHMNAEALKRTIESGQAWFWSRSRGQLWLKGEQSGATLSVVELRVDCDQDCIWLRVRRQQKEATCHTGRESCFYRRIVLDIGEPVLTQVLAPNPAKDPRSGT